MPYVEIVMLTTVCLAQDYDQDEIISNSRPTCFAQDEIYSS